MKPLNAILFTFLLISFHSPGQITVKVLSQTDSAGIINVVCTNALTNAIGFTNEKGELPVKKNTPYVLVHPSFYSVKIGNIQTDTMVYLAPLVRDIEEVVVTSMTNENLFKAVIQKYRADLSNKSRQGTLNYKNTNWFTYQYKEQQTTDSAYCSINNTLNFEYAGTKKKNEILFSPIELKRYCGPFTMPENLNIKTAELPAYSKFDFSLFLGAIFDKGSFFDKVGFDHTATTKKEDSLNQTIELKFLSSECEKTVVLSSIDSSLISYQFRFNGKFGSYHVYYAMFSKQEVQTLYEEKGYLFRYEKQNHLFHSVHYGRFENTAGIRNIELKSFEEIIKNQVADSSEIEILNPLFRSYLIVR